jgi:hypothetical protein
LSLLPILVAMQQRFLEIAQVNFPIYVKGNGVVMDSSSGMVTARDPG